jgi:signal transduction histidine kinase
MGLAVVLGIVRAHDGVITVESKPGQGSVFRVFLPVSAAD